MDLRDILLASLNNQYAPETDNPVRERSLDEFVAYMESQRPDVDVFDSSSSKEDNSFTLSLDPRVKIETREGPHHLILATSYAISFGFVHVYNGEDLVFSRTLDGVVAISLEQGE